VTAAKAILYVLLAVAGSSAAVFTSSGWDGPGRWNILVLAIGALGVSGRRTLLAAVAQVPDRGPGGRH
jgi:hypothetical protein